MLTKHLCKQSASESQCVIVVYCIFIGQVGCRSNEQSV